MQQSDVMAVNKRLWSYSPVELGAQMRAARVSAGLTQMQAHHRTGIARTTIVRGELGYIVWQWETFVRLCHEYETTPGAVLRRVGRVTDGQAEGQRD